MTVTLYASGTQTTVITTEHVLSAPNAVGQFSLQLDLNALAANDVLEVRAYKMVLTGGTSRQMWMTTLYGAQPSWALDILSQWIANTVTDSNAIQFTIKQTFGSARAIPWAVYQLDDGANVTKWNGTAVATPATAGIPDVNIKNVNNVAATSVTTVNANLGTTQPQNFTGTGASALVKGDAIDWASGAIPTPNVTGVPIIDLKYILGTVLTETAGQIAAAFKKFFNIATPQATMDHGILVDTVTTYTGNTPQTGDAYARIGAAGAGLTALGDARIAHLDADVTSRLAPTVAARTLDVSAGGEAGLDWANIGSPTTAVDLSGTTVKNVDNAIANVTTVATTTNLTNAPTAGDFTATMKTSLNAATPAVTVSDKTGFSLSAAGIQAIWDRLTSALTTAGSIGKLLVDTLDAAISTRTKPADTQARVTLVDTATTTTTVGTVNALATDSVNALALATDAVDEIAAAVLAGAATIDDIFDEPMAGHTTTGTAGADLTAAASGDVLQINGSTTAAAQLALSAATIVSGTAATGTLSTTQMTTDLTETNVDQYVGRILIFTSGLLINQATDITAYSPTGGKLTFTAITDAPSANDTFIVV